MKPLHLVGHVDKNGKLELDQLPPLEPGQDLRVLIMETSSIAALERIIEMAGNLDTLEPELLAQLEALDEALWDMQFATSKDALTVLADEARSEHEQGKTVELDLDDLKRWLKTDTNINR